MSRASQVAFANAYLESQGIEAQTVDVHALIDGTLSYEENLKAIKRHVGHGGRSKQKAARGLSAAECDVAIGNCAAGFVEDCKDACKCGDPDACEVKIPRKKAAPKAKTPASKGIKKYTNNMPAGYAIHKWIAEDRWGRHAVHVVMFRGAGVFDQNKSFESLPDARKALKTHLETERLRKQIREERAYFEKHGQLGKSGHIDKPAKPKPVKKATKAQKALYAAKLAERKAAKTSPKRVYSKDYKPATTWAEFQKINASQIAKHTKMLKESAESKRQFGSDLATYGNILDKVWLTTKQKATKTKKKVSKTIKPQTTKRKKRSAQKTISGKTKPQKKPRKAKRCVRVKVKGHVRKCPTRRQ